MQLQCLVQPWKNISYGWRRTCSEKQSASKCRCSLTYTFYNTWKCMQIAFKSNVTWRIYPWEFLLISFQKYILRAKQLTVKFYKIPDPLCVCVCVCVCMCLCVFVCLCVCVCVFVGTSVMCSKMVFYCHMIPCQTLAVKRFCVSCDNPLIKYMLNFLPIDFLFSLLSCKHFGTSTLPCGGEALIELIQMYNNFPCRYQCLITFPHCIVSWLRLSTSNFLPRISSQIILIDMSFHLFIVR